jgi:hypothetical protein
MRQPQDIEEVASLFCRFEEILHHLEIYKGHVIRYHQIVTFCEYWSEVSK